MELGSESIIFDNQTELPILGSLGFSSKQSIFKNAPVSLSNINCPDGKISLQACTNDRCTSLSSFICQHHATCQKCQSNHFQCMSFIRLETFINQILHKNCIPKQIVKLMDQSLDKWIDMISQSMFKIQQQLQAYGLTKNEQQLLDLIQSKKFNNITGHKIKTVLKQIDDQETFANTQDQLKDVLQIQLKRTTNVLQNQLKKFTEIVTLARDGKALQYKAKITGKGQRWSFDNSYKYASKFTFENNDKMVLKSMQHRMYSHIIGNKKFNPIKVSEFSVIIMNSQLSSQMFGIGTKKIDRQEAHMSKDVMLYLACNGTIWQKGEYQNGGQRLKRDDMVTIRYDPQSKTVIWLKNYKPLATHPVSQNIRKHEMYPIFSLFSNGDLLGIVDYEQ